MISEQSTVTFLWRCSLCTAVYDGESLALLLDDGTSKACSCGGRLVEGVGPVPERGGHHGPHLVPERVPVSLLRGL